MAAAMRAKRCPRKSSASSTTPRTASGSSGNTNFGEAYAAAGPIISRKCHVPLMYRFELMGTREDVHAVREGVRRFFSDTPTD